MKVVAIIGSTKKNSTTRKAVENMTKIIEEEGIKTEMIHFAEVSLPLFDANLTKEEHPPIVHSFTKKIAEADGVILASPEYHGSVSGVLKNALDYLGAREMKGKLVTILTTAGSELGATNTINTLHQICRNLHAWALPQSPTIPAAYDAFAPDGTLQDKKLEERLKTVASTFVTELKNKTKHH
ncbi:NADPH-dependent FMN reductase [Alkalihalobacillus sp. LMS39]|uniref:NADPH-dependent FMN reductase n=1 Tax=Alkalihalobacillus sp. LMS39 TaxID=2924032 RepID=UPI001FB3B798|nr:NADPH-dependent FMN reductase [Alkalihalobacillus sp. LMS39]UOE93239.1 NAD(P)H-dependent oxidoreductase [Alkalihalobacillus sp. LMS39]